MRHIPTVYLVIAVIALGLFVAGLPAIAGADADPLAGVFALLVALPWILVLNLFGAVPIAATMIVTLAAIALNYVILRWLVRKSRQAKAGAPKV